MRQNPERSRKGKAKIAVMILLIFGVFSVVPSYIYADTGDGGLSEIQKAIANISLAIYLHNETFGAEGSVQREAMLTKLDRLASRADSLSEESLLHKLSQLQKKVDKKASKLDAKIDDKLNKGWDLDEDGNLVKASLVKASKEAKREAKLVKKLHKKAKKDKVDKAIKEAIKQAAKAAKKAAKDKDKKTKDKKDKGGKKK